MKLASLTYTITSSCMIILCMPLMAQVTNLNDPPKKQVSEVIRISLDSAESLYANTDFETFEQGQPANAYIDPDNLDYNLLNLAVFHYSNQYRLKKKLPPLKFSPELMQAAVYHSAEMINRRFYNHINSKNRDMKSPDVRAQHFGFPSDFVGENLAFEFLLDYQEHRGFWTTDNSDGLEYYYGNNIQRQEDVAHHTYLTFAESIVKQWIQSTPHKKNLLNREYRYLGCGIVADYRTINNYKEIPRAVGTQVFRK